MLRLKLEISIYLKMSFYLKIFLLIYIWFINSYMIYIKITDNRIFFQSSFLTEEIILLIRRLWPMDVLSKVLCLEFLIRTDFKRIMFCAKTLHLLLAKDIPSSSTSVETYFKIHVPADKLILLNNFFLATFYR